MDSKFSNEVVNAGKEKQKFVKFLESLDVEDIEIILYIFTNPELKNLVKTFVRIKCCCDEKMM